MHPEESFLADILEHPDDDAVRLIYADWLEEHGDPAGADRAEFIRVQCARASRTDTGNQVELCRRERELLARYQQEWLGPLYGVLDAWTFERGFLAHARVDARLFLPVAHLLFESAPVRRLELFWTDASVRERERDLRQVCGLPQLRRLVHLELEGNHLRSHSAEVLAGSEHLAGLAWLNLAHNQIGDRGVRALAWSPLLTQLVDLDLGVNDIGPAGLRSLVEAVKALEERGDRLRLRRLELDGNSRLGGGSFRILFPCPALAGVVRL
jgi:uncharacterized protein (TIGR02996 family)